MLKAGNDAGRSDLISCIPEINGSIDCIAENAVESVQFCVRMIGFQLQDQADTIKRGVSCQIY